MPEDLIRELKQVAGDICAFSALASRISLRGYQRAVARAVVESVLRGEGRSFVVMFPRQSGKNEIQAQIEGYLLLLLSDRSAEIVKVSPTWKPQSLNAMRRLERVLERNLLLRGRWAKESGYIYRVGGARVFFLSGAPEANIVGATASTLLEVDEAQDVQIPKYDRDIAPMAASTNATRVFWGTAWTSRTLLARELRAARRAEQADGVRRVFVLTADEVAREVPSYGAFAAEQVFKLGRTHPMVKTQFYSEEVDAEGGMFPPERVAMITGGSLPAAPAPQPGALYALLVDVAGEDEGAGGEGELTNPRRDSTAVTVVEVDLSSREDELVGLPTYRVAARHLWTGEKHTRQYGKLKALAELWSARWLVIDATGVGAGLAGFLERALPGRVVPFVFTGASKSKLGWDFLGLVDSGRFKDAPSPAGDPSDLRGRFLRQLSACQYEMLPGPEKRMRWGVPEGSRDPSTGEPQHDDLVISAALCAELDGLEWGSARPAAILPRPDPLKELDRGF